MNDRPALLFVDDEDRTRRLLNFMFRDDYDVHVAASGTEAIALMRHLPSVDVIACNQRLPNMTGVELLAQVRMTWPCTSRVLLTGCGDLVATIGAVNDGQVFRFVVKPLPSGELRTIVADAAEMARHARQRSARMPPLWNAQQIGGDITTPPFDIGSEVMVIDPVDHDRTELTRLLSADYSVRAAADMHDALDILAQEQVGVIVMDTGAAGNADIAEFLAGVGRTDPAITFVAIAATPESAGVVRLINSVGIHRFAIKPLCPDLFRLAVNTAMREHQRRLADPAVVRRRMRRGPEGMQRRAEIFEEISQRLRNFSLLG